MYLLLHSVSNLTDNHREVDLDRDLARTYIWFKFRYFCLNAVWKTLLWTWVVRLCGKIWISRLALSPTDIIVHCTRIQNWTYLLSASHRSLLHGLNPTARKLTTSIQLKNLTTSGIMAQLESEISPVTWSAVYSAKMSNVSVCVRFRPLNARESLRDSGTACIQRLDDKSLTFMVIMRTRPRHRNVTFTSSAAIDFTKSLKITGCAYWQMT